MKKIYDIIPHCSSYSPNTLLSSDLKIIDFELVHITGVGIHTAVPVYVLTDLVYDLKGNPCYETMIRIGFHTDVSSGEFLDYQVRVYSKLEVYKHHKILLKKIKNGFFDNEILEKIRKVDNVMYKNCP